MASEVRGLSKQLLPRPRVPAVLASSFEYTPSAVLSKPRLPRAGAKSSTKHQYEV